MRRKLYDPQEDTETKKPWKPSISVSTASSTIRKRILKHIIATIVDMLM